MPKLGSACCFHRRCSSFRAFVADSMDKVSHHGNVENEDQGFSETWVATYLINLERNQRARDDYAEPFGPAFHQPETGPFRQEESRVKEADDAKTSYFVGSEISRLLKGLIDVPIAGIQTKHFDPAFYYAGYIFVKQMESTHANRDEKHRLEEFEQRNETDQAVVSGFHLELW